MIYFVFTGFNINIIFILLTKTSVSKFIIFSNFRFFKCRIFIQSKFPWGFLSADRGGGPPYLI